MKVNLVRWSTGLTVAILVCLMSMNYACTPTPTPNHTPTPEPTITPGLVPADLEIEYSWGACHMDWGFYQLIINSEGEANFEKSQNIAEPFSKQSQFSLTEDELVGLYQEIKNNNFFTFSANQLRDFTYYILPFYHPIIILKADLNSPLLIY